MNVDSSLSFVKYPHFSIKNCDLYFLGQKILSLSSTELDILNACENGMQFSKISKETDFELEILEKTIIHFLKKYIIFPVSPKSSLPTDCSILTVEPHCDDVCFSLTGTLIQNSTNGKGSKILNIFSTSSYIQSGLQKYMNQSNNFEYISNIRKSENKMFANIIGAQIEFCDIQEAIIRGYKNVYIEPHRADMNLFTKLKELIISKVKNENFRTIFFPLGVGKHVDHVLLSNLAIDIIQDTYIKKNVQVFLYEDLPYAHDQIAYYERLGELRLRYKLNLIPHYSDITFFIEKKSLACSIFRTQVHPNFGEQLKRFAKSLCYARIMQDETVDPNCFYERIWSIN